MASTGEGGNGEEIPAGFLVMLAGGVQLMAGRPRLVKDGPRAFARASGLSADELGALWYFVKAAGCVKERRLRAPKVDADCLRQLADALRKQARREAAGVVGQA